MNIDLQKKFSEKQIVKVIIGLNDFDVYNIVRKVKAAEIGGATYIDMAASPNIVLLVKSITSIPICVSSINPRDLYQCVLAGADIIEIGNFDIFYDKNITFSANQILQLAQETRYLLPDIPICVTIPHTLLLKNQINLAISLSQIGINYIQTEGLSTKIINFRNNSCISKTIHKSSSALSSSYAIANSLNIPIIAASGINALSAPIAISYGASGIAIGSALNSFKDMYSMSNYIKEIVSSISCYDNHISSQKHFKITKVVNIKSHRNICCT